MAGGIERTQTVWAYYCPAQKKFVLEEDDTFADAISEAEYNELAKDKKNAEYLTEGQLTKHDIRCL